MKMCIFSITRAYPNFSQRQGRGLPYVGLQAELASWGRRATADDELWTPTTWCEPQQASGFPQPPWHPSRHWAAAALQVHRAESLGAADPVLLSHRYCAYCVLNPVHPDSAHQSKVCLN
jgi:hypothetical protein